MYLPRRLLFEQRSLFYINLILFYFQLGSTYIYIYRILSRKECSRNAYFTGRRHKGTRSFNERKTFDFDSSVQATDVSINTDGVESRGSFLPFLFPFPFAHSVRRYLKHVTCTNRLSRIKVQLLYLASSHSSRFLNIFYHLLV